MSDLLTMQLGRDLVVQRLGFGTLHITTERGFGPPRTNAVELLRAAVAAGVNFIDTADSYGPGHAENVIRKALHPYRGLVVATKGGYEHVAVNEWQPNARPEHLQRALEGSLTRLGVERIDLYQLHTPDEMVNYEDSVGALKHLHEAGKIRYVGISNVNLPQLTSARKILGDALVSVQNCYNIFYHQGFGKAQEPDNEEILSECDLCGFAFIARAPVVEGKLEELEEKGYNLDSLHELMQNHGATAEQTMIAALLHRSEVIIAIPGTSSLDHLAMNLAAGQIELNRLKVESLFGYYRPVGLANMRKTEELLEELRRPIPDYSAKSLGDWRPKEQISGAEAPASSDSAVQPDPRQSRKKGK